MAHNYYTELGVPKTADEKEIKGAYRRLARKYHPDVNPNDASAEDRFKRVNEAYQVLSDIKTRRDYDQFGDNWKHAEQMRSSRRGHGGFRSGGAGRGFGGMGLGDLFGGMDLGNAFGRSQQQSLRTDVQITLEEAFGGSKRAITIQGASACSDCSGTGVDGTVLCAECGGSGTSSMPRTLEVAIPKGTASGDRIRVRPDGLTELTIDVDVRRHRIFTRNDDDLLIDVSISYLDALLGGEVEVHTMNGKIVLKVPPGTTAARSFRITGKGMPRHGRGATGNGDLLARMVISVPGDLTDDERSLLEELRYLRDVVTEENLQDVDHTDVGSEGSTD